MLQRQHLSKWGKAASWRKKGEQEGGLPWEGWGRRGVSGTLSSEWYHLSQGCESLTKEKCLSPTLTCDNFPRHF